MKRHNAFTMIELIFVIIIMAFIGTYGVEFMASAYRGFVDATVYNRMQAQSEAAVTQIASRLQYRIRDSVIVRQAVGGVFNSLPNAAPTDRVLEWVGYDIDGWRGTWNGAAAMNLPNWSGFIDVDAGTAAGLVTPNSNLGNINQTIGALSNGGTVNSAAIFFIGANTNLNNYGWAAGGVANQSGTAHPVAMTGNDQLLPRPALGVDFSGVDVYEYYQLAWSAYAIVHNTVTNQLLLRYNYQPWNNNFNATQTVLMENVDQFRFQARGEMIWIQVCTKDQNFQNTDDGNYSVCKEKVIF